MNGSVSTAQIEDRSGYDDCGKQIGNQTDNQVDCKAFHRPVPKMNKKAQETTVVTYVSIIVGKAHLTARQRSLYAQSNQRATTATFGGADGRTRASGAADYERYSPTSISQDINAVQKGWCTNGRVSGGLTSTSGGSLGHLPTLEGRADRPKVQKHPLWSRRRSTLDGHKPVSFIPANSIPIHVRDDAATANFIGDPQAGAEWF